MITRESKTVGILGGMGPYATISFYQILLAATPVTKDWDHLRVIIDVNPHIPSRSRHHLYGEESPVPAMIESCRRLEKYPVDFIAIPCNSACCFISELQSHIAIRMLNIIEIATSSMANRFPAVRRVAVVGGVTTYERRIYEPFLNAQGIEYVHHPVEIQRESETLIEMIKINTPEVEVAVRFQSLIQSIHQVCGIDAIIQGCTEFGCMNSAKTSIPIIDSSRELAHEVVKLALA